MFFRGSKRWYGSRDGQQHARGAFLMIFCHNRFDRKNCEDRPTDYYPQDLSVGPPPRVLKLYGLVRTVQVDQCGHWMMGKATAAGWPIQVSGTYGSDGLPLNYEAQASGVRALLVELPHELAKVFWAGGGHNSAGSEAQEVAEWATANEDKLRRKPTGK